MAKKGEGQKTVRHFTAEEVTAIRAALMDRPRDLSLFDVGCHLGLRGGDLLSLTWPQVLDRSRTDIGDSILRVTEQKTKRTANFPVSQPIRQALLRWWKLSGESVEGPVWPSRKGGQPMKVGYLHYMVNKWADAAELRGHFGSHSLRKTFGRAFLAQGGTVPQLAHRFGHRSTSTTRAYLGLDEEEVNGVACAVDLTADPVPDPEPQPQPKKTRRKHRAVPQGAFVTSTANAMAPPAGPTSSKVATATPTPERHVRSKETTRKDDPERSESDILADWRKLPTSTRVNVIQTMLAELGTELVEQVKRKME